MKNTPKIFAILLVLVFASCTKPIEYYNKAVYAGNANPLSSMERKIERLQEGYGDAPTDMRKMVKMLTAHQITQLEELKGFMGNADSDAMITAAYNLLEHDLNAIETEQMQKIFVIVDSAQTIGELEEKLTPLRDYYDKVYEEKDSLYQAYDKAITAYADAHDIEMTFYGPDIIPGQNDTRKKP